MQAPMDPAPAEAPLPGGEAPPWLILWAAMLPVLAALEGWRAASVLAAVPGPAGVAAAASLLAVPAVLCIGLAQMTGRGWRAAIEARHGLVPRAAAPPCPALDQAIGFLEETVAGTRVMVGPSSDALAFAHRRPDGARVLAICGGGLRLWEQDRDAAEAVLLHEAAHLRAGEAAAFGGAGRLRRWLAGPWLLLAVVVLAAAGATAMPAGFPLMLLGHAAALLLVPVAVAWGAELGADRYASRAAGPAAVARVTAATRAGVKGRAGLAEVLTHPPHALRVLVSRDPKAPAVLIGFLLLVPAAWAAAVALRVAGAAGLSEMAGESAASRLVAADLLLSGAVPLAASGVALAAWPFLARHRRGLRETLLYAAAGLGCVALGAALVVRAAG